MVLWQELRKIYGKIMRHIELRTDDFCICVSKIPEMDPRKAIIPCIADSFRWHHEERGQNRIPDEMPFSVIFP